MVARAIPRSSTSVTIPELSAQPDDGTELAEVSVTERPIVGAEIACRVIHAATIHPCEIHTTRIAINFYVRHTATSCGYRRFVDSFHSEDTIALLWADEQSALD